MMNTPQQEFKIDQKNIEIIRQQQKRSIIAIMLLATLASLGVIRWVFPQEPFYIYLITVLVFGIIFSVRYPRMLKRLMLRFESFVLIINDQSITCVQSSVVTISMLHSEIKEIKTYPDGLIVIQGFRPLNYIRVSRYIAQREQLLELLNSIKS